MRASVSYGLIGEEADVVSSPVQRDVFDLASLLWDRSA